LFKKIYIFCAENILMDNKYIFVQYEGRFDANIFLMGIFDANISWAEGGKKKKRIFSVKSVSNL